MSLIANKTCYNFIKILTYCGNSQ